MKLFCIIILVFCSSIFVYSKAPLIFDTSNVAIREKINEIENNLSHLNGVATGYTDNIAIILAFITIIVSFVGIGASLYTKRNFNKELEFYKKGIEKEIKDVNDEFNKFKDDLIHFYDKINTTSMLLVEDYYYKLRELFNKFDLYNALLTFLLYTSNIIDYISFSVKYNEKLGYSPEYLDSWMLGFKNNIDVFFSSYEELINNDQVKPINLKLKYSIISNLNALFTKFPLYLIEQKEKFEKIKKEIEAIEVAE